MEQIIFKLTIGKTKGLWQLPLKESYVEKIEKGENVGYRQIGYAPGTKSMFIEDLPKDIKLQGIWFNNGIITVSSKDKLQLDILKAHGWFNKYYEVYDANADDKKALKGLELKNKVGRLIEDADADKVKAIALAVFGKPAFKWGEDTCKLQLLKKADLEPLKMKRELESTNYEAKYIAALAFSKEIVKLNATKTAVIWNDTTEGSILHLSKGEVGMTKLGEYLSKRTDETLLVLQEIGNRIENKEVNSNASAEEKLSAKDEALKVKEDEIESLKAKLAALEAVENAEPTIKQLREQYKAKLNKDVPPNMKNNTTWLKNQITQ